MRARVLKPGLNEATLERIAEVLGKEVRRIDIHTNIISFKGEEQGNVEKLARAGIVIEPGL